MTVVRSLKVLARIDFPTGTLRLWEGSGPYLDADGNVWRSCVLGDDALDAIETAINAEAWTLELGISGVARDLADGIWQDMQDGNVIDSVIRILIQDCDDTDQPVGEPEVKFTGRIDNLRFDDAVQDRQIRSAIIIECTNRFALRSLTNGAVLSDVDQRARAARLNLEADADRFCERVPSLGQKTINWPAWN